MTGWLDMKTVVYYLDRRENDMELTLKENINTESFILRNRIIIQTTWLKQKQLDLIRLS